MSVGVCRVGLKELNIISFTCNPWPVLFTFDFIFFDGRAAVGRLLDVRSFAFLVDHTPTYSMATGIQNYCTLVFFFHFIIVSAQLTTQGIETRPGTDTEGSGTSPDRG